MSAVSIILRLTFLTFSLTFHQGDPVWIRWRRAQTLSLRPSDVGYSAWMAAQAAFRREVKAAIRLDSNVGSHATLLAMLPKWEQGLTNPYGS